MRIDSFSDKSLSIQGNISASQSVNTIHSQQDSLLGNVASIGEQRLSDLIEHGNKVLQRLDTRLQWSMHKESSQYIVRVIDTQTDEVLREIPPEKYLDLVINLCEQVGLFLDERT
ncbi:flagellar protein FlaG [Paenibacillus massiliensis]|uniref:flagellar protein FlaG n=1 Tax=Paenibacillus massiliensis TaxID=225917 RepID=UPI00041DB1C8|nr:flagellar protein FlaG [Paenibacillus massiliensis]